MPGSSGNGCGEEVGEGGRIATATVINEFCGCGNS